MTQLERLQRLLDSLVAAGAPGAAAWVQGEDGSLQAAGGVADISTGRPMEARLRFRAGSLTKSLVATIVLQLVAEGRLSLADTLEHWLPKILPYGDQVTIRQLLGHTSGVPQDWATIERTLYGSRQGRFRSWSPQALVALVAGRPPSFPPGTAWSYSNTGYILLGLLVETAGGATLAQELQRRIVEPLGLRSTYLPGDAREIPGPMSRGYSLPVGPRGEVLDGPLLDFTAQNPSWAWAAGALVSDLEDLVGFFRALLGGRLLPPGLLARCCPPFRSRLARSRSPCTTAMGWGCWRWGRPLAAWSASSVDPRLSQHGPEHPGRPPATRRHEQRAGRPGRHVRGVHADLSRALAG
jgi:D-alanyl-D-alanine carboxypeptidase